MLHDLVRGVVGTTTNDVRLLAGLVVLDGDGVFADIFEPDVFQVARSVTVDPFGLVFADDDVAESSTRAKQEDSIRIAYYCVSIRTYYIKKEVHTALGLLTAGTATSVVLCPSTIENLACRNLDDLAIGLGRRSRWQTSGVGVTSQSSR